MSGAEQYHKGLTQPFRIQKRLTLNQCFRAIRSEGGDVERLTYVTFGGRDLYDVMDLVAVFDLRRTHLHVVSYERDLDTAEIARKCPVASTLSNVSGVRIQVVPNEFPRDIERIVTPNRSARAIYYLDYTGTFNDYRQEPLEELLENGFINDGDFLLITSCLNPRIVHRGRFMVDHERDYIILYGMAGQPNRDFRVRNHVDVLIGLTVARHERTRSAAGEQTKLWAKLIKKYKYKDSKSPMGLWLFRFESVSSRLPRLNDRLFEDFPLSISAAAVGLVPSPHPGEESLESDVPDLFDFE
jgi:hypothetical protein